MVLVIVFVETLILFIFIFFFQAGTTIPPCVTVGDEVMLPEFGGTKVTLEEKDYYLFRESELLAKMKNE